MARYTIRFFTMAVTRSRTRFFPPSFRSCGPIAAAELVPTASDQRNGVANATGTDTDHARTGGDGVMGVDRGTERQITTQDHGHVHYCQSISDPRSANLVCLGPIMCESARPKDRR
jgi:hypothetical protein